MVRSLQGDNIAYETMLSRIAVMVRGYLFNSMGPAQRSDEKIEDLVQEVLLAIHRKKHLYRPDLPILPWLFAIARYKLIDQVRSEKRRPSLVDWDDTMDPIDSNANAAPDERVLELEELLDCLSPRQKTILIMAKANGVPLAEIAQKFGMTLSAVKVTVHRALNRVRQQQKATST
jgi:RNA polymerase sigma-70 factor, ECF subfamily